MSYPLLTQIDERLLPLPVALYILGMFLKRTPKVADWCIPWILIVISCIIANPIMGLSINAVIQGVLACGISVLGNQLYKQSPNGIKTNGKKKRKKG